VRLRGAWLAAIAVVAAIGLTACSAAAGGGSGGGTAAAPGPDALNGAPQVELTFWHGMSGANGDALTKLTDQFNQQHAGKIHVNLAYKNTYDDTLAAYKAGISSGQLPDIVQMYDIGTRFMIDSKSILPIQSFVDADKYDVSDIQPNIAGYYTVDGALQSMPFNTSMPLFYFNKAAFTQAGLDPNTPPRTLADIRAAAEKIKANPAPGVQYPFGASLYGWFLEQFTADAGQNLCEPANGHSGRATSVSLASDTNVALLTWWQGMVRDGLAMKLDSNTDNGDNAFTSGVAAMSLESTGSLGGFIKGAAGRFEVGTGPYPKVDAAGAGGPIIGGASLWVVGKGKSPAQERASWEFTKFLASTPSQVAWHTATGYFPISKAALNDPTDKAWVAQRPQFATAITQLQQTPLTPATQGCSVGVMPQVRKDVENAMQAAILQNQDPRAALTTAQNQADQQIGDYTKSLGG
jgi:sn-glycerol 3-phosphate transport system substrate-binding protein